MGRFLCLQFLHHVGTHGRHRALEQIQVFHRNGQELIMDVLEFMREYGAVLHADQAVKTLTEMCRSKDLPVVVYPFQDHHGQYLTRCLINRSDRIENFIVVPDKTAWLQPQTITEWTTEVMQQDNPHVLTAQIPWNQWGAFTLWARKLKHLDFLKLYSAHLHGQFSEYHPKPVVLEFA